MCDEQESGEDYSALIDEIRRAFADVPYPGDDDIIATPAHVAACDECGGLRDALAGRTWPELIDDAGSSGHVGHAMSFFSPAGWQYYLPAYLIQSIKLGRFSSLYFRPRADPGLAEFWAERVSRLTADQCRAVVAFLLVVQKEDRSCRYEDEHNQEAVDHWKDNYRKAAARSQCDA